MLLTRNLCLHIGHKDVSTTNSHFGAGGHGQVASPFDNSVGQNCVQGQGQGSLSIIFE